MEFEHVLKHNLKTYFFEYWKSCVLFLRGLSQFLGKKFIIEDRNLKVSI